MYHIFFIHSSIDGHLGCSHVLAIVNSATMNILVHASFWIMFFSRYCPGVGLQSHMVALFLDFKELPYWSPWSFPGDTSGKEPTCQCKRQRGMELKPGFRRTPGGESMGTHSGILPGESLGQTSLLGYISYSCKESERIEVTFHAHKHTVLHSGCTNLHSN